MRGFGERLAAKSLACFGVRIHFSRLSVSFGRTGFEGGIFWNLSPLSRRVENRTEHFVKMRNRVSRIFLGDKVRNPRLDFLGCDSRKHHCPKPRNEMPVENPLVTFSRREFVQRQDVLFPPLCVLFETDYWLGLFRVFFGCLPHSFRQPLRCFALRNITERFVLHDAFAIFSLAPPDCPTSLNL